MIAELLPWFPIAGKAGDVIVVGIGIATLVAIAVILLGKRPKSDR